MLNLERMKVEEMSLEALSTRWCRHSGLPGLSQIRAAGYTARRKLQKSAWSLLEMLLNVRSCVHR